jgi:hypothetical protein
MKDTIENQLRWIVDKVPKYQLAARLIDKDNEIEALQRYALRPITFEGIIEIENPADDEGNIDPETPESFWMDEISNKADLAVRAILSPLPNSLGLFTLESLAIEQNRPQIYEMKIWIIPA